MAEQTLNIPQLIVFIILAVLGVRWYMKPSSNSTRQPPQQGRSVRLNPAQVDQITQMFPQLDRRQIAWDLQRNGGNVAATTERVLSGRGLETPPTSFNPPLSRSQPTARTATPAAKPSQPDLITRYNLASKVNAVSEPSPADEVKPKAWSQDKTERQSNLQRRRDEMILAARRKMEEKDKARASGASA
ncbi:AMFR protein-like protein [Dendryphion nanum]|uniref:Coupling of ubiquitin conjugation to ER degradation protein 1 n=1 Tax=Dendryphion nanum TaxID=256645 RepID=A0A9P9IHN3_9PLEO|nr:AMFR protein-like protein [Dendryphion nanum]